MNLLSSLNAGFAGAANGTAEIYIRGTSTRAVWYGDFEASTSNSSGADIPLDAYGSAEVYVNQLVDVKVKDADGVLYRQYTDGYSSPNMEVISPAFTGHDYVSGAAAVSEPTTLQAVLDLWATNAGAPDWKVSIGGSATTMLNAFGTLSGLVYNVKSPVYGAVGDGVTNDQAAIQAALAAAVAAGGGVVFFPKGTYLISTAMVWDDRVAMLGVGQGVSIITTNSASNARMVTFTSGSARKAPVVISGLTFQSTQTNSGQIIYSSVTVNLLVDKCHLGATVTSTGTLISLAGASRLVVFGSRLTVNSTSGSAIDTTVTANTTIIGTIVEPTNSSYTGSALKLTGFTILSGVTIDLSLVSLTIPNYGIELQSADDVLMVTGTLIYSTASYPLYGLRGVTGAYVRAFGNVLAGFTAQYSTSGVLQNGSFLELGGGEQVTSAGTAFTVPDGVSTAGYKLSGTVPTFTMPTIFFAGQRLTIVAENNSAGNWVTPNFNNMFSGDIFYGTGVSGIDVATSSAAIAEFVAMGVNSATVQWACVAAHSGAKLS